MRADNSLMLACSMFKLAWWSGLVVPLMQVCQVLCRSCCLAATLGFLATWQDVYELRTFPWTTRFLCVTFLFHLVWITLGHCLSYLWLSDLLLIIHCLSCLKLSGLPSWDVVQVTHCQSNLRLSGLPSSDIIWVTSDSPISDCLVVWVTFLGLTSHCPLS